MDARHIAQNILNNFVSNKHRKTPPAGDAKICILASARFENDQFKWGTGSFEMKKLQIHSYREHLNRFKMSEVYLDSEDAQNKESRFATGP